MGVEIERKFLVKKEIWEKEKKPQGELYIQGYLMSGNSNTVRVRITPRGAFLTLKTARKGFSRGEFEYSIPKEEANEILKLMAVSLIEKVRFKIEFEGNVWEVDEFLGANSGLILAEIELKEENQFLKIPDWVGEEVSDRSEYYNSNLAKSRM